jgi:beta-glucosidase
MPEATYHFPKGFMWGTATAAHQMEGQNNNNWSDWENQPGKIIEGQKAGLACDWWGGRWREDFENAYQSGQNAHRLSIEWSRIQPEPDRWDDKALNVYVDMVRWLVDHKMTPLVTLHHFTDPLWSVNNGGWENEATPALFEKFVRHVVPALSDYVNLWVTINEPNVYIMSGWASGVFPPGKNDLGLAVKVMINMVKGHALAYKTIHELQPSAQVGVAVNYRSLKAARSWSLLDKIPVKLINQIYNNSFADTLVDGKLNLVFKKFAIPEAAHTQDFIGVNYYSRDLVKFNLFNPGEMFGSRFYPKEAPLSGTGFIADVPDGMFDSLKWAHRYQLPIIITENGVEDDKDTLRPRYTLEHLHQIWRAANFNWRVKGYFHWSLVDNFEWERGWTQRFGLWGLDVATQKRIRRPSVDLYEEICKENGISSEVVSRFAPEIFDDLFPPKGS